jgi:hypothetical protein
VNYLIFIIIIIILIFDGLPIIKNKQWKELLLICLMLLLGIVLITLKAHNVKSPLMVVDEILSKSLKSIIRRGS